ncbi:MAG TPA: hypothetical protein VGM29_16125, partial [Polyangiaceae bacterium]
YQTALELQADLEQYTERLGKPIKQKELAQLVSELFAQHRAEIRGLIEKQASLQAKEATVPMLRIVDETGSERRARDAAERSTAAAEPRKRWPLVLGAFVATLVGGVAMSSMAMPSWLRHDLAPAGSTSGAAAAARPSASAVLQPPALSQQRDATVSFRVVPPDAALTLDGISLLAGVTSRVLPVNGVRHTLAAEATAYGSNQLDFTVHGDMQVELVLAKSGTHASAGSALRSRAWSKPTAPAGGSAVAAAATPAVATVAAAPSAAAVPERDCRDPFFMDAEGFKHMRPECR